MGLECEGADRFYVQFTRDRTVETVELVSIFFFFRNGKVKIHYYPSLLGRQINDLHGM